MNSYIGKIVLVLTSQNDFCFGRLVAHEGSMVQLENARALLKWEEQTVEKIAKTAMKEKELSDNIDSMIVANIYCMIPCSEEVIKDIYGEESSGNVMPKPCPFCGVELEKDNFGNWEHPRQYDEEEKCILSYIDSDYGSIMIGNSDDNIKN